MLELMLPVLEGNQITAKLFLLQWVPALFCIPSLAFLALYSDGISSPSPDLTSSLLQIVIFVIFCKSISTFFSGIKIPKDDCIILLILGATAIAVKLSNIAFCGTIMLSIYIAYITSINSFKNQVSHSLRFLLPPLLIAVVFCLRGLVLSGAPLYPSTIGYIKTDWSVPIEQVTDMANWVYSWAREPGVHWSEVLNDWQWFSPWFARITNHPSIVVYPVAVFFVLSLLTIIFTFVWKLNLTKHLVINCILHSPIFAGLVFWFLTAPDLRFANGLFILLPIASGIVLAPVLQHRASSALFILIICIILLIVCNGNLLYLAYQNRATLKHISLAGYYDAQQVQLNKKLTKSGLQLYIPVHHDQCWDAPLPCTPYFNENLSLRKPNDLSSGFTVVSPEKNFKGE